ncbi:MAG: helix-turn-helix transcriptional regulator [Porticoccaceae bacterium]|nr:helix-turn-helix transcriptional regulator [Porticoccaceae bacterium]
METIHGHQFEAHPGLLTPRETEIALWTAEGKTKEEAALICGISPRTVRAHIEHGMAKLGAGNLASFIAHCFATGVISRAARNAAAALLAVLVLHTLSHPVDQARLRPRTSRQVAQQRGRRDVDLDQLDMLWS